MNGIDDAAASLAGLEGLSRESAAAIETAFSKAGDSLARSLARAAADGKVSLKELAAAVISAVDAAAGIRPGGGIGDMLSAALKQGFGGARADGGPVLGGGAYLVGERGPEVFRPFGAGTVEAAAGPAVQVHVTVAGGVEGLVRSEAQLASALARAVRMGMR